MPARQTRPCCQGARTSRAACLIASLLPPFFSSLPPIPLFIPLSSCSATSPNTRLSYRIDDKATMPGSNLPPPTWKGVHTFSSSAVIDAQIEAVWAVLLDFSAYPEWNEFIHTMTLVDARSTPLPSQTPAPGQSLLLTVFIPPVPASSRTDPTSRPVQRILTCDVHTHRLGWASSAPKWLMHMERWQALSVVEDEGDGKGEGEPGGEGEAGRGASVCGRCMRTARS
ncbi:hypothetical protein AcW1_002272 [Taiwanofungus camphoratus]|nr:hypothetical protein AcW1_002272 [Antrodia cinnamomea]